MTPNEQPNPTASDPQTLIAELQTKVNEATALSERQQQCLAKLEAELQNLSATRAAAELERDLAIKARTDADAAKIAAEAERDQAAAAKKPAIEAKVATESARDHAIKSSEGASAAQIAAEAARETATAANLAAQTAKTATETELTTAKQAAQGSSTAQIETEKLRDETKEALSSAKEAMSNAKQHETRAETAATLAHTEATRAAAAHNLSTTAGLAGAFNVKAIQARNRERFWTFILVAALAAGGYIGYLRYTDLLIYLTKGQETYAIVAQVMLTLLGLGAPIWLAWIATSMISKSFALREDYSFKASLAQAYVGFRKEAQGLDPLLEQRLFAAAITQLDANPVRLVDSRHPGSPLQDLLQQPFMQEFIQNPTIKEKLIDWFKYRNKTTAIRAARHGDSVTQPKAPPAETPTTTT